VSPAERERIRAQVRESRRCQGLPEHVQDTSLLDRLAGRLLTDGATRRDQGREAASVGSASGPAHHERGTSPNSKGPGLTNRDLRRTTSHSSKR
jgi:hypothetical protein